MHHSFLIMDKANIYLPACALFNDGRVVGGQASFVRGFNPQVVSRQRVVDHYHHYDDSYCTTAFSYSLLLAFTVCFASSSFTSGPLPTTFPVNKYCHGLSNND